MNQAEAMELLKQYGVVMSGHFALSQRAPNGNWRHSDRYLAKDAISPDPLLTARFCLAMAERIAKTAWAREVETIVSPATAGIVFGHTVAYHLCGLVGRRVFSVFAEKTDGKGFAFGRDFERYVKDKGILLVEDVMSSGGSAAKVAAVVRAAGGNIKAVVALANRGGVTPEMIGVPAVLSLVDIKMNAWEAQDCPLCDGDVPMNTNVGHGSEYLDEIAAEAAGK
jgi:orotate phosphoribosyltransferase